MRFFTINYRDWQGAMRRNGELLHWSVMAQRW